MAIAPDRLDAIADFVRARFAAGDALNAVVHAVKDAHPDLTITGAFASVMAEEPFREEDGFSLFLVDGSNHCWVITDKPEAARGLVIAQNDQDE